MSVSVAPLINGKITQVRSVLIFYRVFSIHQISIHYRKNRCLAAALVLGVLSNLEPEKQSTRPLCITACF